MYSKIYILKKQQGKSARSTLTTITITNALSHPSKHIYAFTSSGGQRQYVKKGATLKVIYSSGGLKINLHKKVSLCEKKTTFKARL